MLELFSWWSFVYREKERVFREDGNEMMESQQSTCYPESQKTPTEISPNIKKKKFSQLNTRRREKATWNTEQGDIYSLTLMAFSKTGLGVCLHQVSMTAQHHQCLHEVATNLHWQAALAKKCNSILGRGELAEQNSTLWIQRVTKPGAPPSLPNSQLLSPAKLPQWGIREPCLLSPDRISHQVHLAQLIIGLDIQILVFPLIYSGTTWAKTILNIPIANLPHIK